MTSVVVAISVDVDVEMVVGGMAPSVVGGTDASGSDTGTDTDADTGTDGPGPEVPPAGVVGSDPQPTMPTEASEAARIDRERAATRISRADSTACPPATTSGQGTDDGSDLTHLGWEYHGACQTLYTA